MPISYPCPHCQNTLTLDTRLAGQSIHCPICQATLTAPALGIAVSASPKSTRPVAPPQPMPSPCLENGAPRGGGCLGGLATVVCIVAVLTAAVLVVYVSVPGERKRPGSPGQEPPEVQVAAGTPAAAPAQVTPLPTSAIAPQRPAEDESRSPPGGLTPPSLPKIEPLPQDEETPKPLRPPTDSPSTTTPAPTRPTARPAAPISPPVPAPDAGGSRPVRPESPARLVVKRRSLLEEEELRKHLLLVPEVALDAVPNTGRGLQTAARQLQAAGLSFPGPVLLRPERLDLAGLPLRMGLDCHLGKEPAEDLQALSRKLRVQLEAAIPKDRLDTRPDPDRLRQLLLGDQRQEWLQPGAVPALLQLLQAENRPVRLVLVDVLNQIPDKKATEALAVRALADLSPEVRDAATQSLRSRPVAEYQDLLVAGLSYPWQPVADHAAEALATLDCRAAVPTLARLLEQPEPDAPFKLKEGRRFFSVMRELVRVNHLGNCLLCHPPSFTRADLVRGAVPTPGQALPAPATTPQYYETGGSFIHADVTYLRQDFSVMQAVDNPGAWPSYQRYDYLVRLRPLTPEQARLRTEAQKDRAQLPQREAVLFALRELTGKDLGTAPANWRAYLPPEQQAKAEAARVAEAERVAAELVQAPVQRQEALLGRLRDSQGLPFTEALVGAIPQLTGPLQVQAREALAERLQRMTAATLQEKLQDERPELRRAAALACGSKDDKDHIPDLIPLLEDPEAAVARAAHAALKHLTGQDLGPASDSLPERQAAAARWLAWWKKQAAP
jgi:HEAT repeat protein